VVLQRGGMRKAEETYLEEMGKKYGRKEGRR
jgi:hypothetical protein